MALEVIYSPQAQVELAQNARTAEIRWPGQAESIIGRFKDAVELIAQFPLLSERVDPPLDKYPNLRMTIPHRVGKFIIFFEPLPNEIRIVRIINGVRNYRQILEG
jgi:plasmid stabilization system protein ParE